MNRRVIVPGRLEKEIARFSEKQKKIIFKNTVAYELTKGCSGRCPDCGAGAEKGVSKYIPYDTLDKIETEYGKIINTPYLHFATDIFDYDFEGKDYRDVHNLHFEKTGRRSYISTHIPVGQERMVLTNFLTEKGDLKIDSLSLMKSNYGRINEAFLKMDGFKVEDQMKMESGFEYSEGNRYAVLEKDVVNKFGGFHSRNIPLGKGGRDGALHFVETKYGLIGACGSPVELLDIIDALGVQNNNPFGFVYGPRIHDFYSMDIPAGRQHDKKLGSQFKEHELADKGIGCFHGVVMHPDGFDNMQVVTPSVNSPLGISRTPITPENFNIVPRKDLDIVKMRQPFSSFHYNSFLKKGERRLTDKFTSTNFFMIPETIFNALL